MKQQSEAMRAKNRFAKTLRGGALAVSLAAGAALAGSAAHADQVKLAETGSTLLLPLFTQWATDYQKTHPDVQITTQGTGSGAGISQAVSGAVQIGVSDAYMTDAQMKESAGVLNIPLAVSSQMVNYNVPGFNDRHLKFSGPILAAIYAGEVKYWDDSKIAQLNPGVKLPHNEIAPVHRADGSGDTFIFTQYLSFSTPEWSKSAGYGLTVNWPAVQGSASATANSGMVNMAKGTPYSIAYIGISVKSATDAAGLGVAMLQNKDGKFVLPDATTVGAAVAEVAPETPPDQRISLIFAPGEQSYPIINYEYAIVKTEQPSATIAKAVKDFLGWSIDPKGGNAPQYMQAVGFVALPGTIVTLSNYQINLIH
jgi:phosphate transport system substrate-binding protein